jgi:hypothetical protein
VSAKRCDVVGHQFDIERSVNVGGPSVPSKVDSNDLPASGEHRETWTEHFNGA